MTVLMEPPVAPKKTLAEKPVKASTWNQRKPLIQSVALARDVAEWLADIATYATRRAKMDGKIKGKERVNVAQIADPFLREVIWELRQRIRNHEAGTPNRAIPATPAPPVEPVQIELP